MSTFFVSFNHFFSKLHVILLNFDRSMATLLLHTLNLTFAKIPVGVHTLWACLATSIVGFVNSFLLRLGFSIIFPFEGVIIGGLGVIVTEILYGTIKFIPVKDKRTGQIKRWAIGTFSLSFLIK